MKKLKLYYLFVLLPLFFISCEGLLPESEDGLSQDEVVDGLKTALKVGTDTTVTLLNKPDGYYKNAVIKILLPTDAQVIIDNINKIPGGAQMVEDVILRINRSAEDAAIEAKPIFVEAVTSMTITDALNILNGQSSAKTGTFDSLAATHYLEKSTRQNLKNLFMPKINTSLDKNIVGNISTNKAWTNLTTAYNYWAFLNLKPEVKTNLSDFATDKALDGLFYRIGIEEKKIRKDPFKWALDILKRVFGSVYKTS